MCERLPSCRGTVWFVPMHEIAVQSTHPFSESLEKVLESVPVGDTIISDSKMWIGVIERNGLPDLNPSGVQ